jgi:predicted RNase H-like HicB family nuclease
MHRFFLNPDQSKTYGKSQPILHLQTQRGKIALSTDFFKRHSVNLNLVRRFSPATIVEMIVPISKIRVRTDEDGIFIAKSSLLPGCHAQGQDRGDVILRFQQAAKAHLEALRASEPIGGAGIPACPAAQPQTFGPTARGRQECLPHRNR